METYHRLNATPRIYPVNGEGMIFGAEKYLGREKYYISSAHSRDLSPISPPFSQVSASLFDQPHARQPTQEPLSASVNILLPAYTVATRLDGSRLLFTLLWPAHPIPPPHLLFPLPPP